MMIAKKLLITTAILTSAIISIAQPVILYKKAIGGTWYDYASQVKATPDGGMILIGTTSSVDGDIAWHYNNSIDAYVVKLDAAGAIEWKRVFGGGAFDWGSSIAVTNDGGYIIGGHTRSNNFDVPTTNSTTSTNFWFAKIDATGNVQWKKTYGGSDTELLITVIQLADGSFLAGGKTGSNDGDVTNNHGSDDCWIVKLDTAGNLLWQKTYGGSGYEDLSEVIATNDGGFAFTALTTSNDGDVSGNHGSYDVWMVKADNAGNIQWQRCYGGTTGQFSQGLIQTSTGEYVFISYRPPSDGDGAFTDTTDIGGCWIVKISNAGNLIWENQYGGTLTDYTASIALDASGRYVIAATSTSNDGDVTGHHGPLTKKDYWIFCLDTAGVLTWQQSFGGTDDEEARSVALLNDGNLAVFGETTSNNDGDVQGSGYHWGTETVNPPNSPSFTVNTSDFWVIKITSPNPNSIYEAEPFFAISLFPNPASESFTITAEDMLEVQVNDLAGRIVYSELVNGNAGTQTISVKNWMTGIYLISVRTKKGIVTRKFVVT